MPHTKDNFSKNHCQENDEKELYLGKALMISFNKYILSTSTVSITGPGDVGVPSVCCK